MIPFARAIAAVLLAAAAAACGGGDDPARSGLPSVMAAAGDSITRAFNAEACCAWSDAPEFSWATGDDPGVDSHYARLLEMNPSLRVYNVARSGAKMRDLERQLRAAASYGADYLTVLMGANDLLGIISRSKTGCAIDPSGMTPVPEFRTQFRRALDAFTRERPEASILVASIPNVTRLWSLFSGDPRVVKVWNRNGACHALVGDQDRNGAGIRTAGRRLAAYNNALDSVCATFERCRFDGGAISRFPFAVSDFSAIDYFHPNAVGQRRLADLLWRASFWA